MLEAAFLFALKSRLHNYRQSFDGLDFLLNLITIVSMKQFRILVVGVCLFMAGLSQAAMTPLSLGIIPPVQFPPEDFTVAGARISVLWSKHRSVYGIDLGVVGNITTQNFTGLALAGGFNLTNGVTHIIGLQAAGVTNINSNKLSVVGVQIAGISNYNKGEASIGGLQLSLFNYGPVTKIYGIQAGVYNRAQTVYGLQLGLINMTDSLHGIQIGLLNFHNKGLISVAPIINIGF